MCSTGSESGPSDELYERTLPTSWVLYEFHGEKDHGKFVSVHEKQTGLPKKEMLKTDKVSIIKWCIYLTLGTAIY